MSAAAGRPASAPQVSPWPSLRRDQLDEAARYDIPQGAHLLARPMVQRALGLLAPVVERRKIMTVSGPPGTGKSTLLAWLVRESPVSVIQTELTRNATGLTVMGKLYTAITGTPAVGTQSAIMGRLESLLAARHRLIVIDEAHYVGSDALLALRSLQRSKNANFALILAGHDLDVVLDRAPALGSRIHARVRLEPLTEGELPAVLAAFHSCYVAADPQLLLAIDRVWAVGLWRVWAELTQWVEDASAPTVDGRWPTVTLETASDALEALTGRPHDLRRVPDTRPLRLKPATSKRRRR